MLFNIKGGFGRGGAITEDSFTFDGAYEFARNENGDWELLLLESGTLNWLKNPGFVDMCLIGAGKNGDDGQVTGMYKGAYVYSGKGGDGGRVLNVPGAELVGTCNVTVGTAEGETSITNGTNTWTSANGAAPKEGGRRAEMPQQIVSSGTLNDAGKDGVFAYGAVSDETMCPSVTGKLLAPSGGAGHANNGIEYAGAPSYWDGVYTDQKGGKNAAGQTGAGAGATRNHRNGFDADGIGAGGGGGYADGIANSHGIGGAGSNGALLIRNRRN